jgi:glycosyltransferase involved in cell wall biosynthesis
MRILHVISGLSTGGAEAVLYRLVTGPTAVEHEVICLEGRDFYSGELEEHGVRVHHVDWSSIGSLKAAFRLHRLIRSIDADLVQTWMYRPNFFGGISSRLVGKPVVWNIRCSTFNSYPAATQALAYLGGFLARWIPKFVINCSAESRRLHARIGYDAVEGAVIPNGYDPDVFKPDEARRAQTREALGIPPGSFVIGTIGRWHPQKGFSDLLDAMRLLKDHNIAPRLLMVGRGLDPGNRELGELVRESQCGDLVELVGERTDIPDVARALDLHVLASVAGEGFPNAVAETMLSGTPGVVTDLGDAAAIVEDTGWVVPPGDSVQLADAIAAAYTEWATSPERWRERRAAARKRLSENFTLDRMVEAYRHAWNRVAASAGTRTSKVR